MTSNVQAIGLGRIVVNSALNQPLDAEISIASIEGNVLESLEIRLATDSDFRRANISIEPVVKLLQFNVINGETGPWIHVTTDRSVRTPFLHFLAAIEWSGGRIIREYTALLDPPGYDTVAGQSMTLPSATDRRIIQPGDTYEPVRSGETLMGIATDIDVDKSVTIYQRMFALMHINSEAFIRGNMNLLREGATLIIPSVEMMAGISRILAREEYTRQLSEWVDYHQGIAQGKSQSGERLWVSLIPGDEKVVVKEVEKTIVKEVPIDTTTARQDSKRESAGATTATTATGEYVLRIVQPDSTVPPATVVEDSDAVPVPTDQPFIDPELENVKHRLTLTEENLASTELENEKLLRQIALLAEQIDKSARLIALQDEALALAQQQAILRAQQTAATSSVQSADTTAAPAVPDTAVDSSQASAGQTADSGDQTTVAATSNIGSATSQGSSDQNASTDSGAKEKSTSEPGSDASERVVVTSSSTAEDEEIKEVGSLTSATQMQSGQQKTSDVTTTAVSVDSNDRGPTESVIDIIRSLSTIDGFNKLYQKDEQLVAMLSAAIILILLLLLLVLRRKRSISPDDTPSGTMPIVVPAVTSKRDAENPAQKSAGASQRDDSNASSERSEIPEKSDDTSADRGKATDPISEAGIYLTYGHHD
ncbi:MAG TPA: FimV/HubP family polar landmark protein, partial [Arenicellales bacterium]|nr:FimV/HubP family polar landmark protein [Arenicellales bacterium]